MWVLVWWIVFVLIVNYYGVVVWFACVGCFIAVCLFGLVLVALVLVWLSLPVGF